MKWLKTLWEGIIEAFSVPWEDNAYARPEWRAWERKEPEPAQRYVEVWCYWRVDHAGEPTVSICDDPVGHPHVHLVRVPVPKDVQQCIAAVKDPPACLVMCKFSRAVGDCPKPTNETSAA